jgi:hypothetical protein
MVSNIRFAITRAKSTNLKVENYSVYMYHLGHAVTQWLRHCATNRKVAGSIPGGIIEIFH